MDLHNRLSLQRAAVHDCDGALLQFFIVAITIDLVLIVCIQGRIVTLEEKERMQSGTPSLSRKPVSSEGTRAYIYTYTFLQLINMCNWFVRGRSITVI